MAYTTHSTPVDTEPTPAERAPAQWPVCDDCVNIAWDNGIRGYNAQASAMMELGADVEDHTCEEVETDGEVKCLCACRTRR